MQQEQVRKSNIIEMASIQDQMAARNDERELMKDVAVQLLK
jgi:hypothetical protein